MKREIKIILKDILKLFLVCGSFVLLISVIPTLFYGAKWALSKYYIAIPGVIIILILLTIGFCIAVRDCWREYWRNVKKRAKKSETE